MSSTGLLDPGAFSFVCCSLRSLAAFSLRVFYRGACGESDDEFSEEGNYVPPSVNDNSNSTGVRDEDHYGGGDSTSVDSCKTKK